MKRDTFLKISLISFAFLVLPLSYCSNKNSDLISVLCNPIALSQFLDDETIYELGILYLKMISESEPRLFLVEQLLKDIGVEQHEQLLIKNKIINKIRVDFQTGRIIILNGWIISITEAQQCALFTFQ